MAVQNTTEIGTPVQASASKLCKTGPGAIIGLFVSSVNTTSRIALCDAVASVASAGAGRFVAPFAPTAGFTQLRMAFGTGLYVSLSGSAQQVTFVLGPTT